MPLSPELSLLAESCSLDDLQQSETRGKFVSIQEYPTMKHLLIPMTDIEFYIGWCKDHLENRPMKRKEKIYYWNKLGQLQIPHLQYYYIVSREEKEHRVTPVELELMKAVIISKL